MASTLRQTRNMQLDARLNQRQRATGQENLPIVRCVRRVGESSASGQRHRSKCEGRESVPDRTLAKPKSHRAKTAQSTGWRVLRPRVERSRVERLWRLASSGPAAPCPDKGAVASLYLVGEPFVSAQVQDQFIRAFRTDPDSSQKILRKSPAASSVLRPQRHCAKSNVSVNRTVRHCSSSSWIPSAREP